MANRPPPGSLKSTMEELHDRYLASLADRHGTLNRLWTRFKRNSEDLDAVHGIQDEAHRLAGTAGSYGFPDLGDLARAVDTPLRGELARPTPDAAFLARQCDQLLPALLDALRRAVPDQDSAQALE
ncbi:Hpt domain-containing protein [Elongatibacter sediminis]|uniref:Hpt domain-containing protein n=1 Tax=Elongatibacter sediminis TaxID=3119006 RepID=A0AAW9RC76_9GAMM